MTLASSLTSVVSNDTLPPEIEVSEDCGYIEGKVKEIYGIAEGGLGFVFPIDDETDNYNFEITKQTDTEIQFEASPENPQDDAVIAIDYRDLAGNGGVYKHFYKGLNIDFHGDIGIPNTEFGKSGFTFYRVKNNSDTIRTIYSVTFFKDTRLSYELENGGKLPYKMQPGEELLIKLIFSPIDDPAALDDSVFIRVDCNYMSRSRVRADVLLPKLLIKDLNFGKVLIFTQKKNEMIIVNNGTADIELERMEYIDKADEFYIDTIGVFPRRLLIDDTLKLEVTFSPKETKSYMASVYFVNNKNISNSCTITGIGAAPDVPDLIVDWGQKRVGTDNDTTVYLHNRGNWKAKIDYLNTISNTHEDANKNTLESLDNTIFESDSIALNLKYIPIKNEIYKIETNNQIAELSDSTFIIRLTGEPTIPEINLHEIYLGKVLIDDTVTGNYPAFTVGGNEHLTIKSISPILPVNTDFSTDVNTFAGQSYTVGQTVEANVQFAALELGRRTQYYLIEHDAMPNYAYKKDTLKIYADVIPRDTVLPVMEIIDDTGELCRMDSIVIRVRNRGNIDFLITDFSYQFENNPYFEAPPSLALPLSVSKDSFYDIAIENIFVEQEQSSLDVSITVNDTITIANEYDLTYTKLNNKISGFTEILAQAGQIDTVLVSGSLPGTEIDNIYLNLNVEFDYEILSYQGDEVLCIISGGGRQDCIKTKISMLQGKLFIQNPISIVSQNEERIWTVVLPFKVLYKNETSSQIHFEATFDACYLDIVEKIAVKVLPICIFDLLPIKINDKLPSVSINSRIVSSELELEVYIPESDFLISDIYDVTGEKINLNSELFLHKGASKLLIDVKSLTPGSYLLNVQYQSYNKKILFIKSI
jgi:hypothetical protein